MKKYNYNEYINIDSPTPGEGKIQCRVIGKVSGANAYVVVLNYSIESTLVCLRKKFGYPIRHIKLEWGNFLGGPYEFIVPV